MPRFIRPPGVVLSAIAKPSLLSRPMERLVQKPPMLQPSPVSTWVELWATHRALPQEIPTGPDQRRRGCFHSVFPILFIVQRQHCTLVPCSHHLNPEHFFPGFLSPICIAPYPFQHGSLLVFHGQFHTKKKRGFLVELLKSSSFTSSSMINQPPLKTLEQKVHTQEIQKYRMVWVRRDLKGHPVQAPPVGRDTFH